MDQLDFDQCLNSFPRAKLLGAPTPVERLNRLSDHLGIDLWIKRDDLTGLSFAGNKARQLEFYLGEAQHQQADTILITGAVQSNFVRSAAAAAAKLGMESILQLEERVPGMGDIYRRSGNVLLAQILGAEHIGYPRGEDEYGADFALETRAEQLRREGRRPFVIHLGTDHPPLGALGYIVGATELSRQIGGFDLAVVPSGSGATHGGFLTGLRMIGETAPVFGICVRRDQNAQKTRMQNLLGKLTKLIRVDPSLVLESIELWDGALSPGYGQIGPRTREALTLMARTEGIFLDPVYSAKTFAGLLDLLEAGVIQKGAKVVLLHTGGQPALFAYQEELQP